MKNQTYRLLAAAFLAVSLLLFGGSALAEGSKDMHENGGYRVYTAWDPSTQVGNIPMTTKIYAYAKAGETIYFGSSVYDNNSIDIGVYNPSGVKTTYNVLNGSTGHINTVAKETAGPLPASGGYSPLSITVSQTGIWQFEFYPPSNPSSNNTPVLASAQFPTNSSQGRGAAAWDVTVKTSGGAIKEGRVFTYYLAANTGLNSAGNPVVKSDFYVLTKDGYIFKTYFNGADPYRFIFAANNRGFVDKTNNSTLYHSPSTKAANDNNLNFISNSGNVALQMPNVPDTTTDITHRIFFNYPSSDLPASIPTTPVAPAAVTGFKFVGTSGTDGKTGNDGEGGSFVFTSSTQSSFQIIIDTDRDGLFEAGSDREISNLALAGENIVFWDGKDANGNILTNLTSYNARIEMKGGEYHFPFLDCENNVNGVKIQLLNPPSTPAGYNPYTVYYDTANFVTANGTSVNLDPKSSEVGISPRVALEGVDSSSGAAAFNKDYGDKMGLHLWTYFPGGQATCAFEIVEPSSIKKGFLSGYVFLDKNNNAVFDSGEPSLGGVTVNITDKDGAIYTVVTDASGHYTANIPWGAYTVSVVPLSGYTLTTGNQTQTGTLSTGYKNLSDVGYYLATDMQILKTVSAGPYNVGKTITYTLAITNAGPAPAGNVTVSDSLPAGLEYVSDSSGGAYDPDTGELVIGNMDAYSTVTVTITARIIDAIAIDNIATVTSSVDELDPSNNTSNVVITGQPKVNNPPVAVDDSATTPKNTPVDISVLGNDSDPDDDTLTVIEVTQGANGTVTINADGTVKYTPNSGFTGTDTFTYTISDGNGGTDTATVTVTIEPRYDLGDFVWIDANQNGVQDAGEAGLEDVSVSLLTSDNVLLNVTTTDAEGKYAFTNLEPGQYRVLFSLISHAGSYRFTVAGTDASSANDSNANPSTGLTAVFTLSEDNNTIDAGVIPVNPPAAVDDTASTPKNTPVNINVLGNDSDPDGDTLTVTEVTQGSNGTVTINPDGTVKYTPNNGFTGTDTFTYTISDGNGGTDTATVTVTVYDGNHPPVAVDDTASTPKNTPVNINVLGNDSDPDGDTLTVTEVTQGSNGTVSINPDGTVKYTPNDGFTGIDSFTYTISDGNGGTDTATVTVTVYDGNHPPVAVNDSATTPKNTPVNINVLGNDSDPDGDTLTVIEVTQGSNGTVTINANGTVKYTPNNGFTGTDTFTYTISDGNGGTDTATVTVTVTAPSGGDDYECDEELGDPSDPVFNKTSYTIQPHAGTGTGGFNGEKGSPAPSAYTPATGGELYGPRGLAIDKFGRLFIADEMNGSVRMVVKNGSSTKMTTITGNGTENGYTPANETGAAYGKGMYEPMDVAIAPCGKYVFFLDTDHHLVRMIDQNGNLKTIAGVLVIGSAGGYSDGGGNPLLAKFNAPQGIAIDKNGNLYIADTNNHIIRKINLSTMTITNIAGTPGISGYSGDGGSAANATLNKPIGLAIDSDGNLYVADSANHVIRKIDFATGKISTVVGSGLLPTNSATSEGVGDNGDASAARLYFPHDIAIDAAGNLYIADSANHRIRKVFKSTNTIITIAGDGYAGNSGMGANATSARLNWPKGVVVDANGVVYISDTLNHSVKKLVP